jgi:hypothetical protein
MLLKYLVNSSTHDGAIPNTVFNFGGLFVGFYCLMANTK